MMDFLALYGSTILVGAALVVLVVLVIRKLVRDRKKGISSCSGGCGGCAMAGSCKSNQGEKGGGTKEERDGLERGD